MAFPLLFLLTCFVCYCCIGEEFRRAIGSPLSSTLYNSLGRYGCARLCTPLFESAFKREAFTSTSHAREPLRPTRPKDSVHVTTTAICLHVRSRMGKSRQRALHSGHGLCSIGCLACGLFALLAFLMYYECGASPLQSTPGSALRFGGMQLLSYDVADRSARM